MTSEKHRTVRISVEVDSEFRSRIKSAAAAHGVSMRDYVVAVLHRALASEESGATDQGDTARSKLAQPVRLSESDRQRGFDSLALLEHIREQIEARSGKLEPESWELLNASRDERGSSLAPTNRE
jgi:plasmid stability protein